MSTSWPLPRKRLAPDNGYRSAWMPISRCRSTISRSTRSPFWRCPRPPMLGGSPLKELPDVLDAPNGDTLAQLHWLGKAAGLDAGPPGGLADRDRPARRNDGCEPDKTRLGESSEGVH